MKLGLSQSARLEQRLVQSPQMIQAMQILQLASLDLQARIQQEMVENPFLELVEPTAEEAAEAAGDGDAVEGLAAEAGAPATDREGAGVEGMLDELERYERDFGDGRPTPAASSEEGDRKYEAMQNTPDLERTLAEDLLDEVGFLDLDPRSRVLAEYLVHSLDERGYLPEPLEAVAAEIEELRASEHAGDEAAELIVGLEGPPVSAEELALVLIEVRRASHPALGARDLEECLLLQVDARGLEAPLLRTIVREHLEDVQQNRLPRIAKETGRTLEEIKDSLELLKGLDPYPSADYGDSRAAVISPDVLVEEVDGEYEVRLDRQRVPELCLSPAYRELLRQARSGDGVREWVKKRLESARWFIDAVRQRQSTLERIANSIFVRQRRFLDEGVDGLQPLRMQEVADEVGVHISTVSRAVAGKYAQTPRGIFPLKYFFTSGTPTATGGVASQASVKQRIAEIVAQEDPENPLSDDQIAARLKERDDIGIARRTVTKYRKALAIPSSSQRRKF